MTEVQEQFSKIAESGKKTFSSLFTKVKAKMQEFDQSRNAPGPAPQSSWGYGAPSGAMSASQGQNFQPPFSSSQPQAQYYAPAGAQAREPRRDDYGHQGYDASPAAQQPSPAAATESSIPVARAAAAVPTAERIPPRPTSTGPPPAGNVDPTKIGMLPKRPVSLIGFNPQASPTHAEDDDDELDYVENPFEDRSK
ncbi:hypothetical protein M0805_006943 [Coniferiporia weirii]|nr:hypothetical protein M0805_006943 [Coniferiporia weirii]